MTDKRLEAALIAAGGFLAGVVLAVILLGANHDHTKTVTRRLEGRVTTQTQTQTRTVTHTDTVEVSPDDTGGDDGSTGADTASVPDVVGESLDDAESELEDAGFDHDTDQFVVVSSNWVVTDQDPEGGSERERGDTIRLAVERR